MSSGYDNLNNILLKQFKDSVVKPISICVNKSLTEDLFPQAMKLVHVYLLLKSKSRSETNNYQPISLLLALSKLLEKSSMKGCIIFYMKSIKFITATMDSGLVTVVKTL